MRGDPLRTRQTQRPDPIWLSRSNAMVSTGQVRPGSPHDGQKLLRTTGFSRKSPTLWVWALNSI